MLELKMVSISQTQAHSAIGARIVLQTQINQKTQMLIIDAHTTHFGPKKKKVMMLLTSGKAWKDIRKF